MPSVYQATWHTLYVQVSFISLIRSNALILKWGSYGFSSVFQMRKGRPRKTELHAKVVIEILSSQAPCPCQNGSDHVMTCTVAVYPVGCNLQEWDNTTFVFIFFIIPGTAPFAQHGCTNWVMEQYLESLTFTLRILKVFHILQQRRAF